MDNINNINAKAFLFESKNPVYWIAFGFGSGLLPVAPGTYGTLVGVLLYLLVYDVSTILYVAFAVASFIFGCWACDKTTNALQVHDFSGIVWDEVVGFLITMAFVPMSWASIVFGFILFRLFDIYKPWPINIIDKYVKGGFGIMSDDAIAGVFAGISLYFIQTLI